MQPATGNLCNDVQNGWFEQKMMHDIKARCLARVDCIV